MKTFSLSIFFLVFFSVVSFCQYGYQVIIDSANGNQKILKGEITKDELALYNWYEPNRKSYTNPEQTAITGLKLNSQNVNIVVFAGTWCEDTRIILPKFFRLIEESGFPESRIVMYGVDRNKKTSGSLAGDYKIINVPAIIVMKDGREIGRVVEFGKSGKWDKDFAEIFSE